MATAARAKRPGNLRTLKGEKLRAALRKLEGEGVYQPDEDGNEVWVWIHPPVDLRINLDTWAALLLRAEQEGCPVENISAEKQSGLQDTYHTLAQAPRLLLTEAGSLLDTCSVATHEGKIGVLTLRDSKGLSLWRPDDIRQRTGPAAEEAEDAGIAVEARPYRREGNLVCEHDDNPEDELLSLREQQSRDRADILAWLNNAQKHAQDPGPFLAPPTRVERAQRALRVHDYLERLTR